jgi:hypothetical protein
LLLPGPAGVVAELDEARLTLPNTTVVPAQGRRARRGGELAVSGRASSSAGRLSRWRRKPIWLLRDQHGRSEA